MRIESGADFHLHPAQTAGGNDKSMPALRQSQIDTKLAHAGSVGGVSNRTCKTAARKATMAARLRLRPSSRR